MYKLILIFILFTFTQEQKYLYSSKDSEELHLHISKGIYFCPCFSTVIHCGYLRKISEFCCFFTNATFLFYFCACFTSNNLMRRVLFRYDSVCSDASCQDSAPVAGMLPFKLTIKLSANVWNSMMAEVQHICDFFCIWFYNSFILNC